MNVFLTKFSDKFFYKNDNENHVYVEDSFKQNDFVISQKHISQNSLGIFSTYNFATGNAFNDEKFWIKYNLDNDIFNRIKKIKLYQKQNHYGFIPNELLYDFAKEYLKLIEYTYDEYIKGKNYSFNKTALLNYEKINSILYILSEHNPFLILKCNLENYKQYIYEIDNFYFLKTNYSANTTNGLIVSYDRSINNIAKDDPIRDCIVSRFGKNGKIILADYNAFQPRILFSIAGYDVKTKKDFYSDIVDSFNLNNDRNKIKLDVFKAMYGNYEKNTNFDKIEKLKLKLLNEYNENNFITSITGRRKFIEKDKLSNKLINTYVQLAQSDIIIEFLIKISDYLKNKRTKLIAFISDCFMFDVHETENEALLDFMKNNLQHSDYIKNCFFKLNIKQGKSWAEC